MKTLKQIFKKILRWFNPKRCERCGRLNAETYRQNTFYSDDKLNWVTLCEECRKDNDEYWKEQWEEYYSSVL